MKIVLLDDEHGATCGLCSKMADYLVVVSLTIESVDSRDIATEVEFLACSLHASKLNMFVDKTVTSTAKRIII